MIYDMIRFSCCCQKGIEISPTASSVFRKGAPNSAIVFKIAWMGFPRDQRERRDIGMKAVVLPFAHKRTSIFKAVVLHIFGEQLQHAT